METELTTNIQQSMSDIGQWLVAHQSRLIAAVVLLGIGLLLAFLLRMLAVRVVAAFERAAPGRELRTSFAGVARERRISEIVGSVVSWAVLLFFVATAANALGVALLSTVVATLSQFVPRVFVSLLILVAGMVMGNLARAALASTAAGAGTSFGAGLGQMVRIAIITAAALIAVAELGVDIALLTAMFSVALAALLGGFALAFGLGARTAISNIIGSHYLRQTFQVGQRVRIGGIEGTIAELTATAVMLDGPDGRMIVPAKQFGEMASTLLLKRDAS
jgi:small-conductance mechanosensitive channel